MPQVDNVFTSFQVDTSTGNAIAGLSNVRITIKVSPGGTIAINSALMTDIGNGWYEYVFGAMDPSLNYLFHIFPNDTRGQIESGTTDKRMNSIDRNLSEIGGGFSVLGNSERFASLTRHITKKTDEIKEQIESNKPLTKAETRAIVAEIELPENEEIDLSPITTSIGVVSQRVTKLGDFIRKGVDKEKEEMRKAHEEEMSEEIGRIQELETTFEEYLQEHADELREKDEEKDTLRKDADEIIQMLEEDLQSVGEDTIKTIKKLINQ